MIHEETFTPLSGTVGKLRTLRIAPFVAAASMALLSFVVVRLLNAERKLLLFDLGIGLIFAAVLYFAARRFIASETDHRRRESASTLIGVSAACGALGVFAVTLTDVPLGLEKLPQLVIIQLLGATLGIVGGFLIGFFAAVLVGAARKLASRPSPAVDGAWIGGLTGLIGGIVASYHPHLGLWFVPVSMLVVAFGGYHAARLHQRLVA